MTTTAWVDGGGGGYCGGVVVADSRVSSSCVNYTRFGIPGLLLYPTIALEIILPLFIIIGYQARLSAGLLAIFCIATAFIFHYDFVDQMQTIAFLKNLGLAGGFLFIVANGTKEWAVDREKKYVRL